MKPIQVIVKENSHGGKVARHCASVWSSYAICGCNTPGWLPLVPEWKDTFWVRQLSMDTPSPSSTSHILNFIRLRAMWYVIKIPIVIETLKRQRCLIFAGDPD